MPWIALVLAAVAIAMLLPALAGASPGYDPGPEDPAGRHELETVLMGSGLSRGAQAFLVAKAYTESRWTASARNKRASEVAAGRRLFEGSRGRGFYSGTPHASAFRTYGSGGWFGLLAASGLAAGGKDGPFARSHPELVEDPRASVVMAADYARRLMGYSSFKSAPTWGTLALGWASLTTMANPDGKRAQATSRRFREALEASGFPASFADERADLGDYPGAWQLLERLGGGAVA